MGGSVGSVLAGEIGNALRGDVYEVVGEAGINPDDKARGSSGVSFRTVKRNTTFELYSRGKEIPPRLNALTRQEGFLLIEADMLAGPVSSRAGTWCLVGIFVPLKGPDRKDVADAVRKRFGPGSVLLKEIWCSVCGHGMEDQGGNLYLCRNCRATKQL